MTFPFNCLLSTLQLELKNHNMTKIQCPDGVWGFFRFAISPLYDKHFHTQAKLLAEPLALVFYALPSKFRYYS